MIAWLTRDAPFPPVEAALREPNGLLAAGAELTAPRLVAAYQRGIFPWYSHGQPILWWSPDPRMVLFVDEFRVSRSLRKTLRRGTFRLTVDQAFGQVVHACAATPRAGQSGTWITPTMKRAYGDLHARGHAHSVEAWCGDELAGGLYGVSLGRMFFGESMFAHRADASKAALVGLVDVLRGLDVPLVDCQQETQHLASFGARPIPRRQFVRLLDTLIAGQGPPRAWPRGEIASTA